MSEREDLRKDSGAQLSTCGRYRYRLWRRWDRSLPSVLWIMLNPSTADADANDPTIRKCIGFAKRWGCGAIEVVNLFALRATNPRELLHTDDPIGPRNDKALRSVLTPHDERLIQVVAWGGATKARRIAEPQAELFRKAWGHLPLLRCLGTTQRGQPYHPLMLAYRRKLRPWPTGTS